MGKVTDLGLLKPDHPIFKSGLTIYTPRSARASTPSSQSETASQPTPESQEEPKTESTDVDPPK